MRFCKKKDLVAVTRQAGLSPFSCVLLTLLWNLTSLEKNFCKNLYNNVIKIYNPRTVVLIIVQKQYIQNKSLSFKINNYFIVHSV